MSFRRALLASVALAACAGAPHHSIVVTVPAESPEWPALAFMIGEWDGTGDGATGPSKGGFALEPAAGGKVLLRSSVNEYKGGKHEDLMVIWHAPDGTTRANYFDSEGHAINYTVTTSESPKTVVFLSDAVAGVPRFRLTYASPSLTSLSTLKVSFEIALPGSTEFKPYVAGEVTRR